MRKVLKIRMKRSLLYIILLAVVGWVALWVIGAGGASRSLSHSRMQLADSLINQAIAGGDSAWVMPFLRILAISVSISSVTFAACFSPVPAYRVKYPVSA